MSGAGVVEGSGRIGVLEPVTPIPPSTESLGSEVRPLSGGGGAGDHLSDLSFHFVALVLTESY